MPSIFETIKSQNDITTDIALCAKLTNMLSTRRSCYYDDWIRVGYAIYSINNGDPDVNEQLFGLFDKFSANETGKYDPVDCRNTWNTLKKKHWTIKSLYHWANQDNPEEYSKLNLSIKNPVIISGPCVNVDQVLQSYKLSKNMIYESEKSKCFCITCEKID